MCGLRLCRSAVVKVPTDPLLLTPPQDCIARGDLALLLLQVFFEVRCCSFFDRLMQLVIVSAWSLAKFKPTAGAPPRTILLWYNYTRFQILAILIHLFARGRSGGMGLRDEEAVLSACS